MKTKILLLYLSFALLPFYGQAQQHRLSREHTSIPDSLSLQPEAATLILDTLQEDGEITEEAIGSFYTDSHLSWQDNIKTRLNQILQGSLMETTQVGLMVWNLHDDMPLYSYGERKQLRPASTMKCITAIAALDCLQPHYELQTRIFYSGSINDSTQVLNGDLYCCGGMDPLLSHRDLAAMVEAIKAKGIKQINGGIYADLSFKNADELGKGWCWDDDNPKLKPLLLNRKDLFVSLLAQKLSESGIQYTGYCGEKEMSIPTELIHTIRRPLSEVMMPMMKKSDNLFAESVFYQLAAACGGRKAGAKHAAQYINDLIRKVGLSPSNYSVADGSGLSLYNYLSAELEVQFLRYAYRNAHIYNTLRETLPIAGVDGTLRNRMKGTSAAQNVRAKTGTLMGVSSLAGYATASNGHLLCFAIIINGGLNNKTMQHLQNKICVALTQ